MADLALTHDIDINVFTKFLGQQGDFPDVRFAFAYHVTMTNQGDNPLQLRNRYWLITDGNGEQQEVSGAGVIGEEPVIPPSESFSYTSGALLKTPVGTMQGHYEFEANDGTMYKAPIDVFSLALNTAVN